MSDFSISFTQALKGGAAAHELAARAEAELGGGDQIAGGLLLATAAAGPQGPEVGHRLSERWIDAELVGTSFEGLVSGGRIWRDEPALGLLAWGRGEGEPTAAAFESGEQDIERIADGILSAVGATSLGPSDLVLLFPDAHGIPSIEGMLTRLETELGCPAIAGAAACGVDGSRPIAWAGDGQSSLGGLVSLVVPGPKRAPGLVSRVRTASATRAATPWLEVTACRSRWIDRLENESALERMRLELGLPNREPLEGYLNQLLIRLRRRRPSSGRGAAVPDDPPHDDERYVVGVDERRGCFSLPVEVEKGDTIAMAWPDPSLAREGLRVSLEELDESPWLLQFSCRARDADLHGDADVESAWVAAHASERQVLGTVAPFQLGPGPGPGDESRMLVHSSVLAALVSG